MTYLRRYWLEIFVFLAVGFVLIWDTPNGLTWMNTDSDGAHYILAAKYLTTAHHMSAPLYLLLGRLFLFLPLNSEAWRMGLMSVLGTMGSCVFIYLILRHLLKDNPRVRLYAIVSVLVFGGSALVISQSTIIETYALATMCGVGAYYFTLKNRWLLASVILGAGLAIHPFLAFIVWAALFVAFKELRNWRRYGITILFFSFYLYIPITKMLGNDLGMWGNTTPSGFFGGTASMALMLTGGLSMWDFPKRVIDTILILLASFGLGIIPLVWHFAKERRWKYSLLWLVLIPIIYFITDMANQTYVYLLPSIAFGSVAVGLGLSRMKMQWSFAVLAVAIGLLGFNGWYFNIDRLDPDMSAMKFYNDLSIIPDGDKFMGGGWTWAMVYVYNKEEGRNIVPISVDALPSDEYLAILEQEGIKYEPSDSESYITKQGEISVSIAELNEGIWIAKETKPGVYQYEIVLAKGNEAYIGRWIGQEIVPEWKWKPSNPYLYISGQLEVSEWHHILWSNRSMLHISFYGALGYGAWWFLRQMLRKRKVTEITNRKVGE
jgi:hypothetical protein